MSWNPYARDGAVRAFTGTLSALRQDARDSERLSLEKADRGERRGDRNLALSQLQQDREERASDKKLARDDAQRERDEETKRRRLAGLVHGASEAERGGTVDVDALGDEAASLGLTEHFDPRMNNYLGSVADVAAGRRTMDDPGVLEAFNWRHAKSIGRGVGEVLGQEVRTPDGRVIPKGSTITDKSVANILPVREGGGVALNLNVTVRTPDGQTLTYAAPRTKNASSSDSDEVVVIPAEALLEGANVDRQLSATLIRSRAAREYIAAGGKASDLAYEDPTLKTRKTEAEIRASDARVRASDATAQAASSLPQYRARMAAAAEARASAAVTYARGGGASGARGGGARRGSQLEYLEYVADNVFDGDIGTAFRSLRGGNTRQIAATMAGKMAELQRDAPRSKRKAYDELYQDALAILQEAAEAPDPEAVDDAGGDVSGADAGEDFAGEDFSGMWGD